MQDRTPASSIISALSYVYGKWHYSDCLAFHQWRQLLEGGFTYVAQTYAELARCSAPPSGFFSSLVEKENYWLLVLFGFLD